MSVAEELSRIGGIATHAVLVDRVTRAALASAVTSGEVVKVAHGRYALPSVGAATSAAHALSGVVCLESAALHWGWPVKLPPGLPQVSVPRSRKVDPGRAAKVDLRRLRLGPDDVVDGVTSRERTVTDCLRLLPFDAALAVADSALRSGWSKERLVALVRDDCGPHSRKMREVAGLADSRAANPFESVLRSHCRQVPDLNVQPQIPLRRAMSGGATHFLGRPDLVDERLGIVIEADSFEWHGDRAALRSDARRYNWFSVDGWLVLRFAWEDVMFESDYVVEVLTAAAFERTNLVCPACRHVS